MRTVTAFALILSAVLSLALLEPQPRASDLQCGRIEGTVIDKKTEKPLGFANVVIVGTQKGAMALDDGHFTIKCLPPGTYTVKVMMMGYKAVEMPGVVVKAGETKLIFFRLEVTIVATTQEILVTGQRKHVDVTSSDVRTGAIALKSGLVKTGDDLHARGGRSGRIQSQILHNQSAADRTASIRHRRDRFTTENYDLIKENEFLDVLDNPVSTFSIDVDVASYSNVRRFISEGRLPPSDAVRIEEMINYFSYDYPDPRGRHPFSITAEVASCPWAASHQLVHIGLQGKRVAVEDLPPNNLVFLLDVSGSMQPYNKLPLLKAAFRLLVDNLRAEDRVAIVVYAGAAGMVLPSTPGTDKQTILDAINQLYAGGTTAGAAGIRLAYRTAEENFLKSGNNRVILATDGDFNVGVSSDGELVRLIEEKRQSDIYLTVLGFGTGNLKDSRMEKLADKGNGHYAYIDNIHEARKVLVSELGATLLTIAKDVKIQIEFNPAKVASYRLIGYENRLLRREDFDDDTKDAGELGAGHSVTALYEIVPTDVEERAARDDRLRYVAVSVEPEAYETDEVLSVRFRYKPPDSDTSRLISERVTDREIGFGEASEDLIFSAAVAEFGLLLRDSKFKGQSSFEHVLEAARVSADEDGEGYRAEFIRLVEACRLLSEE